MSDKNNNDKEVYGGLLFVVFIVFLVLKLTGTVDWSWWYVTLPLWIPFAIVLTILLFMALVALPWCLLYYYRTRK